MRATILPDEFTYLRTRLQEYREAKQADKKVIVTAAVDHVCHNFRSAIEEDAKRKLNTLENLYLTRDQAIKTWFKEEGRVRFPKAQSLFDWKPWNDRKVFAHLKKDEIDAKLDGKDDDDPEGSDGEGGKDKSTAGGHDGKRNIGARQKLITSMLDNLDEEEKEELKKSVQEWNTQRPPPEVRAEGIQKYRDNWLRDVCMRMGRLLDCHLLIVSVNQDHDGDIEIKTHHYYKELMEEAKPHAKGLTDIFPDADEKLLRRAKQWGALIFDHPDSPDIPSDEDGGKTKTKGPPEIKLEIDHDGYPILPDEIPASGNEMKVLMRGYMTICWNKSVGKARGKRGVPWLNLSKQPDKYISTTKSYLPKYVEDAGVKRRFNLCEPSKMTVADLKGLFDHWIDRDSKSLPPFKFRSSSTRRIGLPDSNDKDPEPPRNRNGAAAGPSKSKATNRKRPKTPEQEYVGLEDDAEQGDAEEEDDEVDDGESRKRTGAKLGKQKDTTAGSSIPHPPQTPQHTAAAARKAANSPKRKAAEASEASDEERQSAPDTAVAKSKKPAGKSTKPNNAAAGPSKTNPAKRKAAEASEASDEERQSAADTAVAKSKKPAGKSTKPNNAAAGPSKTKSAHNPVNPKGTENGSGNEEEASSDDGVPKDKVSAGPAKRTRSQVVDKAPPPGKARPRPRLQNRGSRKKTAADVEDEDRSDAQDLEPELAAIRAAVQDKKRKTNGEGGHDAEPPAKRVKPASSASGVHVPPKRSKRLAKKAP
ncbi:hypothetical protein PLICRDRAFT_28932 [Plicaturopsis crispa FD-325 SS-3]|nr:hypothetical protein PLICRDRAFT_28932 [Plicaturopsis crispa FD-325 SS-3]